MSESFRLAKMVLRSTFPIREYDPSPLGRLLARLCPDEATFEAVESAVLVNWTEGPVEVLRCDPRGDWQVIVPRPTLDDLIEATLREVLRLSRGVREECLRGSVPRFDPATRTIYLAGEPVAEWRNEAPGNGVQIDILDRFQRTGWSRSAPCPGDGRFSYTDGCRNLNAKLRKAKVPLRFRHSDGVLYWSQG